MHSLLVSMLLDALIKTRIIRHQYLLRLACIYDGPDQILAHPDQNVTLSLYAGKGSITSFHHVVDLLVLLFHETVGFAVRDIRWILLSGREPAVADQ